MIYLRDGIQLCAILSTADFAILMLHCLFEEHFIIHMSESTLQIFDECQCKPKSGGEVHQWSTQVLCSR